MPLTHPQMHHVPPAAHQHQHLTPLTRLQAEQQLPDPQLSTSSREGGLTSYQSETNPNADIQIPKEIISFLKFFTLNCVPTLHRNRTYIEILVLQDP